MVEEGQPEFIEQAAAQILRKHDVQARLVGKDVLPMSGEYTVDVLRKGLGEFIDRWAPQTSAVEDPAALARRAGAATVSGGTIAAQ